MKNKFALVLFLLLFCAGNIHGQEIHDIVTKTEDGVTYTYCRDISKRKEPYCGAKVRGKLVVPCNYYGIYAACGFLFAYPTEPINDSYLGCSADVYSPDGQLVFSRNEGITFAVGIEGYDNCLFFKTDFSLYDYAGNYLWTPGEYIYEWSRKKADDGITYCVVERNNKDGVFELLTGKEIMPQIFESCSFSNNNYIRFRVGMKFGIYDLVNRKEILAAEFDDCDIIGNNSIKFKLNGYWGVMSKAGKVYIPTSRQYTKIEYNKTFKKFYFEKEGGYKGECNANGVQTSISKVASSTPSPKPQQQAAPRQTTPQAQPQPQQQPQRQKQPMQVWVPCQACNNSGQSHICMGGGHSLQNPSSTCFLCNGTGRCTHCAGQGGHNEVQYR